MPMGMTYPHSLYLGETLSYRRRFPVVYLTIKVMLRPRFVDKQLEVYAFYMYEYLKNEKHMEQKNFIEQLKDALMQMYGKGNILRNICRNIKLSTLYWIVRQLCRFLHYSVMIITDL